MYKLKALWVVWESIRERKYRLIIYLGLGGAKGESREKGGRRRGRRGK